MRLNEGLPCTGPWVKIRTESQSRIYYHNPETDVTAWDLPQGAVLADEPAITSVEQGVKRGYKRTSMQAPTILVATPVGVSVKISNKRATTTIPISKNRRNQNNPMKKRTMTTLQERRKVQANRANRMKPRKQTQLPGRQQASDRTRHTNHSVGTGLESEASVSPTSSSLTSNNNNEDDPNCCQRFRTMPLSVWSWWIIPSLCIFFLYIYMNIANEQWTTKIRPATPDGTQVKEIHLGTDDQSEAAYAYYNYSSPLEYKKNYNDCKEHFKHETKSTHLHSLCEGYCKVCELGGDTDYENNRIPIIIFIFWTVFFFGTISFFTFLKRNICKNANKFMWADLRGFILLLLVVIIFSTMLVCSIFVL